MPLLVIFGFLLTFLVSISFFGLCLYICLQCYTQGFSEEGDQVGGESENGETTTAENDPEELNRETQTAMEKLTKPSAEYDKEEEKEEEGGSEWSSECAICLEEFGDRVWCRVFPNCNHMFHTNCIMSWLGINQTCPICRTQL